MSRINTKSNVAIILRAPAASPQEYLVTERSFAILHSTEIVAANIFFKLRIDL
jgi:hypothetical protein